MQFKFSYILGVIRGYKCDNEWNVWGWGDKVDDDHYGGLIALCVLYSNTNKNQTDK